MRKDDKINSKDISEKLNKGFQEARKRLIEEEKKKNGYIIISKNGKVMKVPASLL